MKFSIFQLSRRGGRELNEDRMGYCYTREAALLVLADGERLDINPDNSWQVIYAV